MKRKIAIVLIIVILIFNILYVCQSSAFSAQEFKSKIDSMIAEYDNKPFVSYYNCTNRPTCSWGGETCFGFQMYALNKLFGTCQNCGDYIRMYNGDFNSISDFRVGDVMRYYEPAGYWDHSFVIIDVEVQNNRVKIMDANRNGNNYVYQGYVDYGTLKSRLNTSLVSEESAAYVLRKPNNDVITISGPNFGVDLANLGDNFTATMIFDKGTSGNAAVISGNGTALGSNVEISVQNGAWKQNQLWKFERQGDGSYYIKNLESNLYLDVDNEETGNGTNIKLYKYSASTAQKWCIIAVKGGGYRLIPKHCYDANLKRGLDIDNGGTTAGTNVHLWEFLGNADENTGNQVIDIQKTFYCEVENLGEKFTAAMIYDKGTSGNAAVISANGTKKGSNVEISKQNGTLKQNQLWKFERQSDGSYYIKNAESDLYLDVDNEETSNDTNIKVWEYSKSTAQKWYIVKVKDRYRLIPKHCYDSGVRSCLDIDAGGTSAGTNVHLWEFLGEPNDYGATQVVYIEKQEYKLGDMDKNKEITPYDAFLVNVIYEEGRTPTNEELQIGDIDRNGELTAYDAYLINLAYENGTELE